MIFLMLTMLRQLLELEMLLLLLIKSLLRLMLEIEIQLIHLLKNRLVIMKLILEVLDALYYLFVSMIIENLHRPLGFSYAKFLFQFAHDFHFHHANAQNFNLLQFSKVFLPFRVHL
jgi:hypothetical protein